MSTGIIIRKEVQSDTQVISDVTRAAFETLAISNHTEQFIIEALREANALVLSLVAEVDGRVVGHIAFSPVTISDGSPDWFGLGPLSVLPELQRQGIGEALVFAGLSALRALGAKGCVLVGDPGYYQRFGFRSISYLAVNGVPPQYVLALPFDASNSSGTVLFHEGFNAKG